MSKELYERIEILENAMVAFTEGASDEKRMALDGIASLIVALKAQAEQLEQVVEQKLTNPIYDTTNGSPYDRGGADSYYRRPFDPHYWPEGSYKGVRVDLADMTPAEITAYTKGYNDNEEAGYHKEW